MAIQDKIRSHLALTIFEPASRNFLCVADLPRLIIRNLKAGTLVVAGKYIKYIFLKFIFNINTIKQSKHKKNNFFLKN